MSKNSKQIGKFCAAKTYTKKKFNMAAIGYVYDGKKIQLTFSFRDVLYLLKSIWTGNVSYPCPCAYSLSLCLSDVALFIS